MRRFLHAIAILCVCVVSSGSAHADAAETLAAWQRVQDPDSGADFNEIRDFLDHHPTWPDSKKIRIRAEMALRDGETSDSEILSWFAINPPLSGVGKWIYAQALSHQQMQENSIRTLVKDAWRDADLSEAEENTLLTMFGNELTSTDHIARVDRLLWEGKITPAQHLIPRLPVAYQVLFEARIALMEDKRTAPYLLGQVSTTLKNDPGLLYERLLNRVRKNDKSGIRTILLHAPKTIPYPQRWWKIRESEIRRAIDEGNYKIAEKLLANHGQSDGAALAEALWLEGWIKLEFSNNAAAAYPIFYHMVNAVRTPVSKARAAYWAGRAAKKSGDLHTAQEWFSTSAKHITTFYGQLAASELSSHPTLTLPDEPSLSFFHSDVILADDIENAIRLCIENGDHKMATRLINHVIESAQSEESMLTVAGLGHQLHTPHISVKAAKKAQQQGVVLKNVGYPRPDTDRDLPIERALTLAITRQESEFDPKAESPSGALGMMQLLPGTAKETAQKIDIVYDRDALDAPNYNMRLGSHYLSRLINAYDGSYIMGIAAYNAGPGNVRKWIQQRGEPEKTPYQAIDWIEKIPFSETRNYVQRVLENLQIYRALEEDTVLKIQDDLTR